MCMLSRNCNNGDTTKSGGILGFVFAMKVLASSNSLSTIFFFNPCRVYTWKTLDARMQRHLKAYATPN